LFADGQNMAHGRWYPTVTTLGDGRVMTFSGLTETGSTNTAVEIYTPGSGWSQEYAAGWTPPLYPRMHVLPDGTVFYSGSGTGSRIFNPSTKAWSGVVASTNYPNTRTYGTSVLLPLTPANGYKPRVIIMGGGNPATATTETIDLSTSPPHWQYGPSMSQPRIEMDATILPNGKVLAVGGSTNDEDTTTASLNADLYDSNTNSFSSAGQNAFPRLYHSGSLLLPDATVLVVGGNPSRGSYEAHMEVYSPAYLFNADGSRAVRPTISGVSSSALSYSEPFQVQTPDAANITSVVLMRPGAPTHSFDMDQRLVGLSFTTGAGVLNVTAPPNGNIAPPGYYMLFVLNSAGVPSLATFLHLSTTPSAPTNLAATAASASQINLTWTASTGNVTSYLIERCLGAGCTNFAQIGTSTSASYSDTPLAASTTYSYRVRATDGTNLSGYSNIASAATLASGTAPAITSANGATFIIGTAGSFTVTATGTPTPTLTEAGALPGGVTFINNGNGTATLSGTPGAGTAGTYSLTITASNGVGTAANQAFTLTVNAGGGFAYVTGSVTGAFSFNGGTTLSVALHQNPGTGHALICATTWQSSTATASMSDPNNGTWMAVGAATTGTGSLGGFRGQMFYVPSAVAASTTVTLTVSVAVVFRSFECAEYSYTGTIALDGTPRYSTAPASGGTATINGLTTSKPGDLLVASCLAVDTTCSVGSGYSGRDDANSYDAASNTFGSSFLNRTGQMIQDRVGVAAGAQSATFGTGNNDNVILGLLALTSNASPSPTITSASSATFTVGAAGSFTVTATGTPTPTLTETGALPSGVTFVNNGNGTATLSGTPASGTAGTYSLTITASNGVGTPASQTFTLSINQTPAITSANSATFTVGTAASFTATATGTPTPSFTETGALPGGVTFVNNGNGTGTLSGTPALGTGGTYSLTITAGNGVGSPVNQSFTLTVNQAPAITSAGSTTFTVGAPGSFTVTTTGSPAPSLTETGALPSGVTFVNNGNGTATFSGTPATATAGSYSLTITASNGVGTAANQTFTLTVNSGGGGAGNFAYVNGSVTGAVSQNSSSGTTLSVVLHQNPGAGHLELCGATWQSPTATASMSDPNNGTWTPIGAPTTGTGSLAPFRGQMFYVRSTLSASTTVTLTLSAAVAFRAFECAEYSYTGIVSLDGTPQYSTTPASGSIATVSGLTTSNSSDLVFAACLGVDTTCTAGSGFTGRNDTNAYDAASNTFGANFFNSTGQLMEDRVGVPPGSQTATFGTGTATDNVILGLAAF
jgi:hypothetical protein